MNKKKFLKLQRETITDVNLIPKEESKQELSLKINDEFLDTTSKEILYTLMEEFDNLVTENSSEETLEEAAEKYANKKGDIPTTKLEDAIFKQGFIDGAKCQQEKMYSEEEVLKIIDLLFHKYASSFRVDAKEDFLLSKKK